MSMDFNCHFKLIFLSASVIPRCNCNIRKHAFVAIESNYSEIAFSRYQNFNCTVRINDYELKAILKMQSVIVMTKSKFTLACFLMMGCECIFEKNWAVFFESFTRLHLVRLSENDNSFSLILLRISH